MDEAEFEAYLIQQTEEKMKGIIDKIYAYLISVHNKAASEAIQGIDDIYNGNIAKFYAYPPTSYRRHGNKAGFNLYSPYKSTVTKDGAGAINGFSITVDEGKLLDYPKTKVSKEFIFSEIFENNTRYTPYDWKWEPIDPSEYYSGGSNIDQKLEIATEHLQEVYDKIFDKEVEDIDITLFVV